jgi:N-acyl-D-aspartate/D-glutamate deacylase
MVSAFQRMQLMGEAPDYEPTEATSIAAIAGQRAISPEAVALDHMLSNGGRGMIYSPHLNYAEGSLDPAYAMLTHPDTVPGLSDGGAHVGMICDGSFPTTLLTHWTRDRTRGPKLPIEQVIKMQAADTAATLGLNDRGRLSPGLRADINLIDHGRLKLKAPQVQYDLPSGGRRLVQRAEGYVATIVAGQLTYRDGDPTGALPGRLLRGARAAPSALAAE